MPSLEISRPWATLDHAGKLTFIDWNVAEELAEKFIAGDKDLCNALAALAVGVREHLLTTKTLPFPVKPKADQ